MRPRLIQQIHQLCIKQFSCVFGADLALTGQCLVETLAFRETLELIDALISFPYSLLPSQVYGPWVDRRQLEINHSLAKVAQQIQCRLQACHQMRLILAVRQRDYLRHHARHVFHLQSVDSTILS